MTATRTGPNATRGLSSRLSTSSAWRASWIAAVDHSVQRRQHVVRRAYDVAAGVVDLVDDLEGVLVDEQEADHRRRLGQLVDPLGDQRHRQVEQLPVGQRGRVEDARGLEERQRPAR